MKIETFKKIWEKVKLLKFPMESEKFSEKGGKSETGGKCIFASGALDAPAQADKYRMADDLLVVC